MNKQKRGEAKDFVEIMRDTIRQVLDDRDSTAICLVESVNPNETLNLFVLPDKQTVIRNIINQCKYKFKPGDTALLYLVNNRLSNSFVIAKYNADAGWSSVNDLKIDNFLSSVSENAVQNKVIYNALQTIENKTTLFTNREGLVAVFETTANNQTVNVNNLNGTSFINWGDGTVEEPVSNPTGPFRHIYATAGNYEALFIGAKTIGDGAFQNSALTSIKISQNIKTIGGSAFAGSRLAFIQIPDNITSIGTWAFSGCSQLTSVKISNRLQSLPNGVFNYCTKIKEVEIPSSVTEIGTKGFYNCTNLETIVVRATNPRTTIQSNTFSILQSGADIKNNNIKKIIVPLESVDDYKEATNWVEYADKIVGILDTDSTVYIKSYIEAKTSSADPTSGTTSADYTGQLYINTSASPKHVFVCTSESDSSWQELTSIDGAKGGSLRGPLVIKGGDGVAASKIALDASDDYGGQITNQSTQTLFGFINDPRYPTTPRKLTIGHSRYPTILRGPTIDSVTNAGIYRGSSSTDYNIIVTRGDLLNMVYPVGSVYMSDSSTSPSSFLGGSWERIEGKFLLSATDTGSSQDGLVDNANIKPGHTGGEAAHTLTSAQIPAHTHPSGSLSANSTNNLTGSFKVKHTDQSATDRAHVAYDGTGIVSINPDSNNYRQIYDNSGQNYKPDVVTIDANHSHVISGNTGDNSSILKGEAHGNMPPFRSVYMWKRVS